MERKGVIMQLLLDNHWAIFITLEVSSLLFLFLFVVVRYLFTNIRVSYAFLGLFIAAIILEALLAFVVYKHTGEFTTFQIVIVIFIVYAGTFGISDFKKMDRYVKDKIGKWKGIDLLTDKERQIMAYLKDPKVIAKRARLWFYLHTIVFAIAIIMFWQYYGNEQYSFYYFLTNLDWYKDELIEPQPFTNELITNIVQIWSLIYLIDTIVNWSYTIFPSEKKD